MFRRVLVSLLAIVGLISGAPELSLAQGDRLAEELAFTDRRIELAETIVGSSGDAAAQQELTTAIGLQQRARSAATASQPVLAVRLSREARTHADRAIALVRGLPDPDRVVTQVERTRELLDRSRDRLEPCEVARARSLVRVSVEMQTRAETALQESRYVAALQLTLSARERLFLALRACRLEDSAQDGASRALAHTDEVLSRARAAVEQRPSEPARQALSRGESMQHEAQGEARAERFDAALRLTQAARALAHRALRLSSAGDRRK